MPQETSRQPRANEVVALSFRVAAGDRAVLFATPPMSVLHGCNDGQTAIPQTVLLSRCCRLGSGYKPRPETSFVRRCCRCSGIGRNTFGRPECWSVFLRVGLTRCCRVALTANRKEGFLRRAGLDDASGGADWHRGRSPRRGPASPTTGAHACWRWRAALCRTTAAPPGIEFTVARALPFRWRATWLPLCGGHGE